jgi:hypothetical protein
MPGVVERDGGQAALTRKRKAGSLRPVADDRDDVDRQLRVDNRLKIAAAPGQQHDNTGHA